MMLFQLFYRRGNGNGTILYALLEILIKMKHSSCVSLTQRIKKYLRCFYIASSYSYLCAWDSNKDCLSLVCPQQRCQVLHFNLLMDLFISHITLTHEYVFTYTKLLNIILWFVLLFK